MVTINNFLCTIRICPWSGQCGCAKRENELLFIPVDVNEMKTLKNLYSQSIRINWGSLHTSTKTSISTNAIATTYSAFQWVTSSMPSPLDVYAIINADRQQEISPSALLFIRILCQLNILLKLNKSTNLVVRHDLRFNQAMPFLPSHAVYVFMLFIFYSLFLFVNIFIRILCAPLSHYDFDRCTNTV